MLVNKIRELSMANATLEAAKSTLLEENLMVVVKQINAKQSAKLEAPAIDREAEARERTPH